MPGMDGLTFLTRAREIRPDLPVIVLSAFGDMANLRAAMNRGAFDFLIKPIEMDDLAATIGKAFEHARGLRAAASSVAQNRALRMFVSSRVAERLQAPLGGVEALTDEISDATLTFLRVCGFDGPVDAASAATTLRRLNASFEIVIPEIIARGGNVHTLLGGALVAVFDGVDHVARAVAACISVRDQLAWVAASAADPPCAGSVCIGVATGKILRGCAGSRSYMRLDDTLLGSPVGAARKLHNQAAPGEILVSDAVRLEVERAFDLLPRSAPPGAADSAVIWSVVRRMPPVRFPGAETMRVDPGEP
jgi:eukaryotic-like serine/threonine-protein kinase